MESEEPLPSPPNPEMMPTDADVKDEAMEESSAVENGCEQNAEETTAKEPESRIVVNKDGKRRKRIKRQKNKTFIDDDGFMGMFLWFFFRFSYFEECDFSVSRVQA